MYSTDRTSFLFLEYIISLTIAKLKNDHKQSVISPFLSGFLLIVFLIFQVFLNYLNFNTRVLGATINLDASEIINLVNQKREEAGLKPLKTNEQLTKAAENKLLDMFQFGYWDHFSPAKRPPWTFILDSGYDYHYAGENLAKDFTDTEALVEAWLNSAPHKANILSDKYEDIGVAIAQGKLNGKHTVLVVQMFGTPFKLEDYEALKQNSKLQQEVSTPVLESKQNSINTILANRFLATKIVAGITVLVLLISIATDIVRQGKSHKISRKHWGHLLFLAVLGTIIWLTNNGNIL
ncbi:MAG: CAP domain-containing protein [Patescibacteria group bacterium]|jgi:uncharacterized protein YkwD